MISELLEEVLFSSQSLSLQLLRLYPIMNLGEEGRCENKVTCPKTKVVARLGLEPEPLDPESSTQISELLVHHTSLPIQFSHNRRYEKRCDWLGVIDFFFAWFMRMQP